MTVSSVVFEAVLAFATAFSVVRLWRAGWRACAFGLSFVGLAAALGALLFAGVTAVDAGHASITRWAAIAGFPAFGGFALWRYFRAEPRWPATLLVIASLIAVGYWLTSPLYPQVIGAIGLLCLLIVAIAKMKTAPRHGVVLLVACALTALAGLLIGTVGQWGPLPRVDWYHLALTAANLGFGWTLASTKTREMR